MYGSHDVRHVDFRGLTGSQRTPRVWGVTQRTEKIFKAIYYARKTFNKAQENYSTTEKEMLVMVFAYSNSGLIYWGPML